MCGGRLQAATLAAALVVAFMAPPAIGADGEPRDLKVVAHLDLGRDALLGHVALAGTTAVVAGPACSPDPVRLIDLADPKKPRIAGTIPVPAGAVATGVDAAGATVAVALDAAGPPCEKPGTQPELGVVLYDVTNPAVPVFLARFGPPARSVSIAGGLALSVGDAVLVHDLADPRDPALVARWTAPDPGPERGCSRSVRAHDARLFDGGTRALVASWDAGVYELDLSRRAVPTVTSRFAYTGEPSEQGDAASATAVLLADRTLALLSEGPTEPRPIRLAIDQVAASVDACPLTEVPATGDLVPAGRGCPGDRVPAGLAGRIAIVDPPTGACPDGARAAWAKAAGAAAAIWIAHPGPAAAIAASGRPRPAQMESGPGPAGGLRIVELSNDEAARSAGVVRSPQALPPAQAVASGELGFVAWHGDGLRVLDLGDPATPTVARFVPEALAPDIVGVALLPNHLVVLDALSGLYVVERPGEGTKDSNTDDITLLLGVLGIAGLLGFVVVPKLAAAASMLGAAAARPVTARVRRTR